ncbi:MAG: hypothetical protein ACYSX1_08695, partial [Planctomycetota bacterium]
PGPPDSSSVSSINRLAVLVLHPGKSLSGDCLEGASAVSSAGTATTANTQITVRIINTLYVLSFIVI